MIRVLHYVGAMNRGGMENFIMNIYRKLDRTKIQFDFAVHTDIKADYDDEIISLGGKILRFPSYRKNPIAYYRNWDTFWKQNNQKYDFFHYHTNSLANITAIKAASKNSFGNTIVHAHSSYANKGKLQKIHNVIHHKNQSYINNIAFYKLATSDKAGNWLFGKNAEYTILNNGIDYEKFRYSKSADNHMRNKYEFSPETLIVMHVGNFLEVKNHSFLLEIFSEILLSKPNSKLFMLGRGPLENEIKNKTIKLGINDSVYMPGSVSNVNEYLSMSDIFIFPSLYEGLGLSMIEAQIANNLVVYSDTIPQASEISDNVYSYSLNKAPKDWAKFINKKHDEYTEYDFDSLKKKYDIDKTLETLNEIYKAKV